MQSSLTRHNPHSMTFSKIHNLPRNTEQNRLNDIKKKHFPKKKQKRSKFLGGKIDNKNSPSHIQQVRKVIYSNLCHTHTHTHTHTDTSLKIGHQSRTMSDTERPYVSHECCRANHCVRSRSLADVDDGDLPGFSNMY